MSIFSGSSAIPNDAIKTGTGNHDLRSKRAPTTFVLMGKVEECLTPRWCPPRCNRVVRGLPAVPGRPCQGRLPSSHLPGRGSVTSCLMFVGSLLTEHDLQGTNPSRTGQLTVMLNCWEACTTVLSVTVSVNVYVPFAVGVPLMVVPPLDPLVTARPGGSCPAVIDQV
jgi:hypothetical protein